MTQPSKECLECGDMFHKPEKNCSERTWQRRKFCTPACALTAVGSDSTWQREPTADSTRHATEALARKLFQFYARVAMERNCSLADAAAMLNAPVSWRKAA